MAAFPHAARFRSIGRRSDIRQFSAGSDLTARSPRPRDGVRPMLVTVWTMGAGGRLDCHWDIEIPPRPPG